MTDNDSCLLTARTRTPWNKDKLTGAKPPLRPKHVWAIRTRLSATLPCISTSCEQQPLGRALPHKVCISMPPTTDTSAQATAIDFARRIVPFWQAALGSELLGVYLIGSLAHGGFSQRYSDIDMAVVTEGEISPQTL